MTVEITPEELRSAPLEQRIVAVEVAVQALCAALEQAIPGISDAARAKAETAFLRATPAAPAQMEFRGLTQKFVTALLQVVHGIPRPQDDPPPAPN